MWTNLNDLAIMKKIVLFDYDLAELTTGKLLKSITNWNEESWKASPVWSGIGSLSEIAFVIQGKKYNLGIDVLAVKSGASSIGM